MFDSEAIETKIIGRVEISYNPHTVKSIEKFDGSFILETVHGSCLTLDEHEEVRAHEFTQILKPTLESSGKRFVFSPNDAITPFSDITLTFLESDEKAS